MHDVHGLGRLIDQEEDAVDAWLPAVVQHAHGRFGIDVLRRDRTCRVPRGFAAIELLVADVSS
jgi:hypothetical protein